MPGMPSVWSPGLTACLGTWEPGIVDCCLFSCFLGLWERMSSRIHDWASRLQSGLQVSGSPGLLDV